MRAHDKDGELFLSVRNQEDTVCSNIVTIYELDTQGTNF